MSEQIVEATGAVARVSLDDVLERFCRLSGTVRAVLDGPADCFCGGNGLAASERATYGIFEFSDQILCFIEDAVYAALTQATLSPPEETP